MSPPRVSVIVVSRGRDADLPLCLFGISQLDYLNFEVILVADPAGLAASADLPFFENLKTVCFDEANISAARNLGIACANGDIVAFIDDDAVPEPTWLSYLVEGFRNPDVAAVGGYVIARNGISFQWKARSVDCFGVARALPVTGEDVVVLDPPAGEAIKTEGTNMALRRDVIAQIGGFDPCYRFYFDETDVNFRLMKAGHRTAIAPLAQVHHGYKASAMRRGDRVPTDLFEIGASTAVFLRKHAPEAERAAALSSARNAQRQRALTHMVSGGIEPRDVTRLIQTFDKGVADGDLRSCAVLPALPVSTQQWTPMVSGYSGPPVVLSSRYFHRNDVRQRAEKAVQAGRRVSAFIFSLTPRPHRVRFMPAGYWLQSGGIFGRSLRAGPRFLLIGLAKRVKQEVKRLAKLRGLPSERNE